MMPFGIICTTEMAILMLLSLLSVSGMMPTMFVGDREVLQPGYPQDPENVRQAAWYPDISELGSAELHAQESNALTATYPSVGNGEYELEAAAASGSAELQIEVWCLGDLLTLGVVRTLHGVELNPEAVTLGDGCRNNGVSPDRLWFTYSLSQCGTRQTMRDGNEVYSNLLQHIPDPFDPAPQRVGDFAIPVHCTVDRLQGDYLSPVMMSVPVSVDRSGFELKAMNSSWTESKPRVRVIVKKGCVAYVVSKRGQARFVPSGRSDTVRFMLGAFHFRSPESGFPQIYLHCELSVHEQKVTPGSKFCNYNQRQQRWEELSGDIAVCSCCKTACDPTHKNAPPGLIAQVSIGPLVVVDRVNALLMETGPALVPQQSKLTIVLETVPVETSSPPPKGDETISEIPLGYQGWAWTPMAVPAEQAFPAYADMGYLDGTPVLQEERWGPPYGAPQGWLSATASFPGFTSASVPDASEDVVIVRHVPVEPDVDAIIGRVPEVQNEVPGEEMDSLVLLQNAHAADLPQYVRDDPSASDHFSEPEPATNKLFAQLPAQPSIDAEYDPILEESGRKKWGSKLNLMIQEGSGLTSVQDQPHRAQNRQQPDPQLTNWLDLDRHDEDLLGDESVVLQKTEVMMHKGRGHWDPVALSWFHSRLALTRSQGPAHALRYELEEAGLGQGGRTMKRRILLEEENIQPSFLQAVIGRMYKAE
ncbi:hypothetical protein AAFF_G00362060 [Aldrovandia affinis]|uniref:ZP domain-containing protein n=1 Tax=Aldrovandia affinis TaxID=143900 RepID=A0AAD7SIT0_9TELE|nr:hypothetical protein AAFF_G00362060 [Aldrovandia affinis]